MRNVKVENETNPLAVPLVARYCNSFFCKLRGLTFRKYLPDTRGLLLVEAIDSRIQAAIHMLFVFMKLGIVWINGDGEVVDVKIAKPWVSFLMPSNPAKYILEIVPERIEEFQIGDIIKFEENIL